MDAEEEVKAELKAPTQYNKEKWKPDLYPKCKKCGAEIGLKIEK